MSWLFSQALVEEYSAGTFLDGAPCAQLNVMLTRRPFWRRGKTMDVFDLSQSGLTSKLLMAHHGEDLLTSYLGDFPVRTSVWSEAGPESTENARGSGRKWRGSFAKYDQDSCLWRTAQCSLLGGLEPFLETWPSWGSMHDGECSAHTTPGWITCGNVSGLWPTPTASDEKGSVTPQTAKKRAAKSSRGVRLPEFLTLKGLLPGGRHNPEFSEWLMGWPLRWTGTEPLEMAKFHEWQQQHGRS
jgi:hypothetical protein